MPQRRAPLPLAIRAIPPLVLAALALVAGTALGQPSVVGNRPDCVTASGQAIYDGYGYRHNVSITNGCEYALDCHVFTSVNPQVQDVHLAPHASTIVPTFLSSPASTFVAHVDCPHAGGREPTITDRGE